MKHKSKLLMIPLCLSLCIGCTTPNKPTNNKVYIEETMHTSLPDSLNAFSISSFSRLWQQDQNLLYSPYSAYLALALCSNDAIDETQQQLLHALCYKGDIQDLNQQLVKELNTLSQQNVQSNTSIWNDQNVTLSQKLKDASSLYQSDIFTRDFKKSSLTSEINRWIQSNTNKKLTFQQPVSKNTAIIYFNTLYLQDRWDTPFDKKNTKTDTFTTSDQKQIQTPFMHTSRSGYYMDKENYEAINLPLEKGGQMLLFLPKEHQNPLDILKDPTWISQFYETNDTKMLDISLPSFTLKQDYSLTDMLSSMGVNRALSKTDAQFLSKNDHEPIYLDDMHQGNYLAVNEEGIEAAAYSEIEMKTGSAFMESVDIQFNRPFLYTIVSAQGTPLFIGYIENPTA